MNRKRLCVRCACLAALLLGLFGCAAEKKQHSDVPADDPVTQTEQLAQADVETKKLPAILETLPEDEKPPAPAEQVSPPAQDTPEAEETPEEEAPEKAPPAPRSAMDEALSQLELLQNAQPAWSGYFDLNGITEVTLEDMESLYGAPVRKDERQAYPGEFWQILTYSDGSQSSGWQHDDGSMAKVGSLYLLPCEDLIVSGVAFGESWLDVVQHYCITAPQKTELFYGEPAIVLYGEVIHFGTYGYVEFRDDAPYCIVYDNGGMKVTFFLEDGCVSAVQYHQEEEMKLPYTPEEDT